LPTSPGRFNVRETLDDLYLANDLLGKAMEKGGIAEKRAIYSAPLMKTQIGLVEKTLMEQKYFGE
ncbi:MAG: glycoside hydrolase family 57, partial [Lentisphaeria bacterium]|nr:glycoside hydrolase family 57 [Lentisphaeria bacterium]